MEQKREHSPEVRWPLPKARDLKWLADNFRERDILLSLKLPWHVLLSENHWCCTQRQPAHCFSRVLYSKRKAICEMYSIDSLIKSGDTLMCNK